MLDPPPLAICTALLTLVNTTEVPSGPLPKRRTGWGSAIRAPEPPNPYPPV